MVFLIIMMVIGHSDGQKGCLTVMRSNKIASNIYKRLRNTILGDVASLKFDKDATKLKNIHMGHLSECGMMKLHQRSILKGCSQFQAGFVLVLCRRAIH